MNKICILAVLFIQVQILTENFSPLSSVRSIDKLRILFRSQSIFSRPSAGPESIPDSRFSLILCRKRNQKIYFYRIPSQSNVPKTFQCTLGIIYSTIVAQWLSNHFAYRCHEFESHQKHISFFPLNSESYKQDPDARRPFSCLSFTTHC